MTVIDMVFMTPFLYIFLALICHISLFLYVRALSKKFNSWIKAKKLVFIILNSTSHLVTAFLLVLFFHLIVSNVYPLLSGKYGGWGYGVAVMWISVIAGGILSGFFSSLYILLRLHENCLPIEAHSKPSEM